MNLHFLRCAPIRWLGAAGLGLLVGAFPLVLHAQSDDFNDGNDTGWTRYDPIGAATATVQNSWSFPNGGYRLQATPSPSPGVLGPARVGSVQLGTTYTEFLATADLLDWNNSTTNALALAARLQPDIGPGTTSGYVFGYVSGLGYAQIVKVTGERTYSIAGSALVPITLNPSNDYRLTFSGLGTALEGRIYKLPNVTVPLVTVRATDGTYTSGYAGLLGFGTGAGSAAGVDVTFDNYLADVPPPRISYSYEPQTGDLIFTWPGYATGFVFQCSTTLPGASWTPVTDTIFAPFSFPLDPSNPNFLCFSSVGPGGKFFRLRRP